MQDIFIAGRSEWINRSLLHPGVHKEVRPFARLTSITSVLRPKGMRDECGDRSMSDWTQGPAFRCQPHSQPPQSISKVLTSDAK